MNPDSGKNAPSNHHRGLIVAAVLVVVVIATGLLAGSRHRTGVAAVRTQFGVSVRPPAGRLSYTNGWVASAGTQKVAVYAGSQPGRPRDGLLVIIADVRGQRRRDASLPVAGAGALTLLRPGRFSSIQAAGQATLHFVTANGGTGTLDLSDEHVALSR